MQAGLYSLGVHYTYGFRVFWRVGCEYSTICVHLSPNLSPSLPPFVLYFWLRFYLFPGRLYV